MSNTAAKVHHLPGGTVLKDRYEILQVLGEGGFGITYKGIDRVLDTAVAIKEYFPMGYAVRVNTQSLGVTMTGSADIEFFAHWKARFLSEARVIAKMSGVGSIVNVRDFFEENGTAYIVMEYLDGKTLKNCVRSDGVFSADNILSLMKPIVKALGKVHAQGLIHRDISPDNIMLMPDGTLKLYDFGAARVMSENGGHSLSILLKPGYAPPEQYVRNGKQGAWTDVYALCATIYFCLTGKVPEDAPERMMEDNLLMPSRLGVSVSQGVESALASGLALRIDDRISSMSELDDRLYNIPDEEKTTAITAADEKTVPIFAETASFTQESRSVTDNGLSDKIQDFTEENYVPPSETVYVAQSEDDDTDDRTVFVKEKKKFQVNIDHGEDDYYETEDESHNGKSNRHIIMIIMLWLIMLLIGVAAGMLFDIIDFDGGSSEEIATLSYHEEI